MNRIILVLGCHRSGTSLVTSALTTLGVELGTRLQPPAADNPAGFFEDLDFQTVNSALLQTAGADWDTVGPISLRGSTASQIVRAMIEDRLKRYPLFGIKDPRFCRTLPFWRRVLPEYADIACVYVLRNPLAVAASLQARNGMNPLKAQHLWLVNTIDALTQADPFWPKVLVDYNLMLAEPKRQILRMSSALSLTPDDAGIDEFCRRLVQPALRHHQGGVLEPPGLIWEVYDLLHNIACDQAPIGHPSSGKFLAWSYTLTRVADTLRAFDEKAPAFVGHRFGEFRWPA